MEPSIIARVIEYIEYAAQNLLVRPHDRSARFWHASGGGLRIPSAISALLDFLFPLSSFLFPRFAVIARLVSFSASWATENQMVGIGAEWGHARKTERRGRMRGTALHPRSHWVE